jgi:hypothetical protein
VSGESIFTPEAAALADRLGAGLKAAVGKVYKNYEARAVDAAKQAGKDALHEVTQGQNLAEGRSAFAELDHACFGVFSRGARLLAEAVKTDRTPPPRSR